MSTSKVVTVTRIVVNQEVLHVFLANYLPTSLESFPGFRYNPSRVFTENFLLFHLNRIL